MNPLPWQQPKIIHHTQRLLRSFEHWTGRSLLANGAALKTVETDEVALANAQDIATAQAQALFDAPFVVVSHGIQADPILNYGNRKALELWQMEWEQLTQTPSRLTAEPIAREERARLLARAESQGFIDDYAGIRISSTGQRFWIRDVVLWNVLDEGDRKCGQVAAFDRWELISSEEARSQESGVYGNGLPSIFSNNLAKLVAFDRFLF